MARIRMARAEFGGPRIQAPLPNSDPPLLNSDHPRPRIRPPPPNSEAPSNSGGGKPDSKGVEFRRSSRIQTPPEFGGGVPNSGDPTFPNEREKRRRMKKKRKGRTARSNGTGGRYGTARETKVSPRQTIKHCSARWTYFTYRSLSVSRAHTDKSQTAMTESETNRPKHRRPVPGSVSAERGSLTRYAYRRSADGFEQLTAHPTPEHDSVRVISLSSSRLTLTETEACQTP